ncbi:MAG: NAD(P)/FAD-dependent oxidoreductase [Lentisphaeria bacterium]|nr:NAD(P)/FAD-dependent oxidoreductase [Lentisphaeria bacterium]
MSIIYDAAIIGGGVCGAAAAYRLSRYDVKTILLEKESDVSFGVSKANSGIVHGGFHYSAQRTLKGRLEIRGNLMYDQWHQELDFAFKRCGILIAAFKPEQMEEIRRLYEQGVENNVPGIELCTRERMLALEPKLSETVCGGLHAPGGGVVEPYSLVFSLAEAAQLNGVELKTRFKTVSAVNTGDYWEIGSESGEKVQARYVINAAGLFADEVSKVFGGEEFVISPRKGEEYLLDRLSPARPEKVIFPVPDEHTKGVLVIPTAGGTTMIGPTAQITGDKTDNATTDLNKKSIFALAKNMVSGVSEKDLITSFSGSRPVIEGKEDFLIQISDKAPRFIQCAGIQSPGLTSAPAIAELLCQLLQEAGLFLQEKTTPFILPEKVPAIREVTAEEADKLFQKDPAWTHIICRCEKVSEAEIRLAIRKGHTTLDGVKLATRAGMGRCQSGFCSLEIMKLIAEETGTPLAEIIKRESAGTIVTGCLGGEKK